MTDQKTDRLTQAEQEIVALTLSVSNRDARIAELKAQLEAVRAQPAPAEPFAIIWAKAIEDAAIEYADVYVELQCDADNDHRREHRTALRDLRETIKRGLENAAIAANKKEPS